MNKLACLIILIVMIISGTTAFAGVAGSAGQTIQPIGQCWADSNGDDIYEADGNCNSTSGDVDDEVKPEGHPIDPAETHTDAEFNSDTDECVDLTEKDSDEDGIMDGCDNCQYFENADQLDTDDDGIGDECKGDRQKKPDDGKGSGNKPAPTVNANDVLEGDEGGCSLVPSSAPATSMSSMMLLLLSACMIAARKKSF